MRKTKLEIAQEKYRVALYRTLEHLLPEAEKQARAKKPALLRILTRAAGRARKPLSAGDALDTEEKLIIDWTGIPRLNREIAQDTEKVKHIGRANADTETEP
jgi:hypothetical protein